MVEAKTESHNTADHPTRIGMVNVPLSNASLMEAICIVAHRGLQLGEVMQATVLVIAEVVN